nr:hypothetical protein [Tanacetum cinerariifolium]
GASFTQGRIPSIPIGGSISPEGFLLLILLLVMIMVMVFIVAVILVVVVAIVGVVIVVVIIGIVVVGGVSFILKLSFVIISVFPSMKVSISFSVFGTMFGYKTASSWNLLIPGDLVILLYSNRFGIGIPPGQGILGESTSRKFHFAVLGTVATRKYRFSSFKPMNEANSSFRTIEVERLAAHKLLTSRYSHGDNGMRDPIGGLEFSRYKGLRNLDVDLTGDEDPIDEDRDTEVGDLEVLVSLGEISSGGKKFQESNIGDTEDGGKAVGEKTSVAKRYLLKSSEELGELFPDVAGKLVMKF